MALRHIVAIGAALALVGPAFAGTTDINWPTVRPLPTTASVEKIGNYGFKLQRATPDDLDHQSTHGVPAWSVIESVSRQGWAAGASAPPPAIVVHASAALRGKIALFNANTAGWLVIPRGWHVKAAGIGMAGGGNSLVFVAPGGAKHGWITYFDAGAGIGDVFASADGLFPGAHRRNDKFMGQTTPRLRLSPKAAALTNPNRCTAVITYRSGNLSVKGVALGYEVGVVDPSFASFFVALPKQDAALGDFLLAAFRAQNANPRAICPHTALTPATRAGSGPQGRLTSVTELTHARATLVRVTAGRRSGNTQCRNPGTRFRCGCRYGRSPNPPV